MGWPDLPVPLRQLPHDDALGHNNPVNPQGVRRRQRLQIADAHLHQHLVRRPIEQALGVERRENLGTEFGNECL
jgi:hypothetical protein